MADHEFDEFLKRRLTASDAYVNGDPEPLDQIVPHSGEASFHSPSGDTVNGAEGVAARNRKDAAMFAPGSKNRFDILQQGSDGDLGFWTGFQIASACMAGKKDPVEMKIRITEIFRRTDGTWKMVHRHADTGTTAK